MMNYLIIAGGRDFTDYDQLVREVRLFIDQENLLYDEITILSGAANGADRLGEQFAKDHHIPVMLIPAQWNLYGKAAGPIRNAYMAKKATHCIIFCDGKSKSSKQMIKTANYHNLVTQVINY